MALTGSAAPAAPPTSADTLPPGSAPPDAASPDSTRQREIAHRLKFARTAALLSPGQAARAAGLPGKSLGELEAGLRLPSTDELNRLAGVYNLSVDWLLARSPERGVRAEFARIARELSRPTPDDPEHRPLHREATAVLSGLAQHQRTAAVLADGTVLLTRAARDRPEVLSALAECVRLGHAAAADSWRDAAPEQIARLHSGNGTPAPAAQTGMVTRGRAQDLAARLLRLAAEMRASDIRVRVLPGRCEVHFRVFDAMHPLDESIDPALGAKLMQSLFFLKAGGDGEAGYVASEPQGFAVRGSREVPLPAGVAGLRVQRGPEKDGDVAVIRLHYDDGALKPDLARLGFTAEQCAWFADARAERRGLIVLAGDKGEGKSTTLAQNIALALEERGGRDNIVTLEDPPEITIPGVVQTPMSSGFSSDEQREAAMRKWRAHFVRMAPDIGMIQEIRDQATARGVFQFVETGSCIWTTLHVDDVHAIPLRLLNLGAAPHDVCYPGRLALLCHQRLMPILCGHCALPWEQAADRVRPGLRTRIEAWPPESRARLRFRNPDGCPHCVPAGTQPLLARARAGYAARRIIAEMLRPDTAYLGHILERDVQAAARHWRTRLGGVPLQARVMEAICAGEIDPRDAEAKHVRIALPDATEPAA